MSRRTADNSTWTFVVSSGITPEGTRTYLKDFGTGILVGLVLIGLVAAFLAVFQTIG